MPTFPPSFVAPPPLLTATTSIPSKNIQTTNDSLRLAAETLFKSNSVHRYPSTQFICSDCHRIVKCCDVSVQASLNDDNNNVTPRLRLVSLTSSDDGLNNEDAWLSFDSGTANQKYPMNHTRQAFQDKDYDDCSTSTIPKMHHV